MVAGTGAHIRSLIWERRHWIILDSSGALYKVELPQAGVLSKGATITRLLEFSSGGIVGVIPSPTAHMALTASTDGSVRVFDYQQRKLMHSILFNQPATAVTQVCMAWMFGVVVYVIFMCVKSVQMLAF